MGCDMFADDVIVISDGLCNLISRKYGRTNRVHLIYNGVSRPEVCDFPEYFEELDEKGKYVLGMCRFVPEKNFASSCASICPDEKHRGIKLVLAGDTDFEDDYSRSLKEAAKANGVVLTGFVKGRKPFLVDPLPLLLFAVKSRGPPDSLA